jgi:hypothetical protein
LLLPLLLTYLPIIAESNRLTFVFAGIGPQLLDPGHHASKGFAPSGALNINRPPLSSAYICHPVINWRRLLKHPAAGLRVFDRAHDGSTKRRSTDAVTATTTISSRQVNARSELVFISPNPGSPQPAEFDRKQGNRKRLHKSCQSANGGVQRKTQTSFGTNDRTHRIARSRIRCDYRSGTLGHQLELLLANSPIQQEAEHQCKPALGFGFHRHSS